MEAPKTTESAPPTPEQLLKMLDLEFERERGKRARTPRNRGSFLAVGIVFILIGAGIALLVAEHLLVDLQKQSRSPSVAEEMEVSR